MVSLLFYFPSYNNLQPLVLGHQPARSRHVFDVSTTHKRRSTSSSDALFSKYNETGIMYSHFFNAEITKTKAYICLKHFLYNFLLLSSCILNQTFLINHLLGSSTFCYQWSATLCLVATSVYHLFSQYYPFHFCSFFSFFCPFCSEFFVFLVSVHIYKHILHL